MLHKKITTEGFLLWSSSVCLLVEAYGSFELFAQRVHVELYTRLQVSGLILVNNVALSQFVEHLLHLRQQSLSLSGVSHGTKLANGITHCLGVIAIVQAACGRLTNSLE